MKAFYHFLSTEEINIIHQETVDILTQLGLSHPKGETRDLLLEKGATLKDNKLFFPKNLVEEVLLLIKKGDKKYPFYFTENQDSFHSNIGFISYIQDHENEIIRQVTLEDVKNLIAVVNELKYLNGLCLPYLPDTLLRDQGLETALSYSKKPVFVPIASLADGKSLARISAGFKNSVPCTAVVINKDPLTFSKKNEGVLSFLAKEEIPIVASYSLPQKSVYIHLDKLILLGNIQNILNFIIVKSTNPKGKVFYSGYQRSGEVPLGYQVGEDFQLSLLRSAQAQMGRYYHCPSFLWANDLKEHVFNSVEGFRKFTVYHSFHEMIPESVFTWLGQGDHSLSYSLEHLILDHEVLSMAKAFNRNFPIDKETLATDLIHEVGPSSHYIFYHNDMEKCYSELWLKELTDTYIFSSENYITATREKIKKIIMDTRF